MRDGPESKRPIVPDTWGYYGVVRLSNPSRTVFGSSPTLTTKNKKKRLGRTELNVYLCKTNNKGIVESKKRETRKVYQPVNTR